MDRRGFLAGILACGMAPAVVRAASLMKVVSPTGLMAPFDFHDNYTRSIKHAGIVLGDVFTVAGDTTQYRVVDQWTSQEIERIALTPKQPWVVGKPRWFIANPDFIARVNHPS